MPAQKRVGFDVGDSSSEEEGENPNEPPDDGIPPQGSTAPRCGAGGARGRRRGPRGGSRTVAAKGTKRKTRDKTGTWGAVENSISIMRNLTKADLDTMLVQIPTEETFDETDPATLERCFQTKTRILSSILSVDGGNKYPLPRSGH